MSNNTDTYKIKCLIVGNSGVGKSSMLERYVSRTMTPELSSTIGVDYRMVNVPFDKTNYKLQIWDTAGQERFYSITKSYFRGANLIFLCFSIANKQSFKHLPVLLRDLNDMCDPNMVKILVGTCSDLENVRTVTPEEAREFAGTNDMYYTEVSSKLDQGINDLFVQGVRMINKKRLNGSITLDKDREKTHITTVDVVDVQPKRRGYCCWY